LVLSNESIKDRIAVVKDLEGWRFERWPFVKVNRGFVDCCRFL